MAAPARGRRVGVDWRGVGEEKTVAVSEGRGVAVKEAVSVGPTVGVGTNALTACCVSAIDVLRFSTTRSTMFKGRTPMRSWLFKSFIASAETLHSRLKPITAAARTLMGPAYSLNCTLVALLFLLSAKEADACCNGFSLILMLGR